MIDQDPSETAQTTAATHSMIGKTVVITGATAGIGKAAATELARRGADLVLVSRNPKKAKQTAKDIRAEAPDTNVQLFTADMSSLEQVRAVAAKLIDTLERIDVLINNAGVAAPKASLTSEGFDEMLATNYLGPFLLTYRLLDLLKRSAPSRIVVVASEMHRLPGQLDPEHFEKIGDYANQVSAQLAYGRTKLLDILMADELARRIADSGVTVNSLCPGLVATEMTSQALAPISWALKRTPLINTPEQGARMTIRLASDPSLDNVTGRFFSSTRGAGLIPTDPRRNLDIANRVFDHTSDLVDVPILA